MIDMDLKEPLPKSVCKHEHEDWSYCDVCGDEIGECLDCGEGGCPHQGDIFDVEKGAAMKKKSGGKKKC